MKTKKLFSVILVVAVFATMLTAPSAAVLVLPQSPTSDMTLKSYTCSGDAVNFREGPGSSYASYGYLWTGDSLWVCHYNGVLYKENQFSFSHINSGPLYDAVGNMWGWVSSSYLTFKY